MDHSEDFPSEAKSLLHDKWPSSDKVLFYAGRLYIDALVSFFGVRRVSNRTSNSKYYVWINVGDEEVVTRHLSWQKTFHYNKFDKIKFDKDTGPGSLDIGEIWIKIGSHTKVSIFFTAGTGENKYEKRTFEFGPDEFVKIERQNHERQNTIYRNGEKYYNIKGTGIDITMEHIYPK